MAKSANSKLYSKASQKVFKVGIVTGLFGYFLSVCCYANGYFKYDRNKCIRCFNDFQFKSKSLN